MVIKSIEKNNIKISLIKIGKNSYQITDNKNNELKNVYFIKVTEALQVLDNKTEREITSGH